MRARIVTALVAIPIVVGTCFYASPLPFMTLLVLAFTLTAMEAYELLATLWGKLWASLATLAWVGLPLASLNLVHWMAPPVSSMQGNWRWDVPVLVVLLPLWAGDTAAIFAGKAFGKHPLAPTISPNKTWEGGIANFVACILAAWGIGAWIGLSAPYSIAVGISTGLFGQLGDLAQSWLKRRVGVKDSGKLLPGHGGFLDRLDSLLFAAIPAVVITLFGLYG